MLKLSPHDDWEIGFYESIKKEADAVIIMGGGSTTLIAGVVAASWGKAVFATPHFHGKAETLYKWMHTASSAIAATPVNNGDIDLMSRPWSPAACVKSVQRQLAEIEGRRAEREQHQSRFTELQNTLSKFKSSGRQTWLVLALIIGFIATMIGGITTESGICDFIWFFLVLFFGGALGASLNQLGAEKDAFLPISSASVIGGGVGIIVGVLQIAPNLSKVFTGTSALKVDIELLFSSAVFALLGGLAFKSTLQNLIAKGKKEESKTPA